MTVCASVQEALSGIEDGATILVGGFGLVGIPQALIQGLRERGVKDLTIVSNNAGLSDWGLGLLMTTRQVRKIVGSYVGGNKECERQLLAGEIEFELVPQGTLAERIRAGGAGIPAFYTPAGMGTVIAEGKEVRRFDGRDYLLERAIKAEFALVKAWRGDTLGNLVYRRAARNFNPAMATAAAVTIAEVEQLVEPGALDPDHIHTASVYVRRIVECRDVEKRIEIRTVRPAARSG